MISSTSTTLANTGPGTNRNSPSAPAWTAWTKERDPSLTVNFEGPEEGVGAVYRWSGDKTGVGQLAISRSDPARGIWYDLDYDSGKSLSKGGITLMCARTAAPPT